MRDGDTLGALELAGAGVRTSAESEFVHLGNHSLGAALSLGTSLGKKCEGTHAGGYEQHGGSVLAGGHAGTATYAGGSIHAFLGLVMGNKDIVSILGSSCTHGNESAGLENLVECRTVNHKVFDDGERGTPPGLHRNGSAILEMTHEELAGGYVIVRAVGAAVDIKRTCTAYTFTAIVVESDGTAALASLLDGHRVATLANELFIEDIQHLKEGCILLYTRNMICFEVALGLGVLLTPNL